MKRKLPPAQQRRAVIFATVNANERAQIEQQAAAEGLTLSAIVRRAVLRDLQFQKWHAHPRQATT